MRLLYRFATLACLALAVAPLLAQDVSDQLRRVEAGSRQDLLYSEWTQLPAARRSPNASPVTSLISSARACNG